MIRVCIVDDHELIREGIKKIIHSSHDICIAAEATNLAQTMEAVERHLPDVVVLDIQLSDSDGLEGLRQIHQRYPTIPILILSMFPEERFALAALRAGAAGYVTKNMAAEELIRAIRKVNEGGTYISPGLADLLAGQARKPAEAVPHARLTERELQILVMLGSGKVAKQIAAELALSISTVNTYRARILRKMHITTTASLIRYAVEKGLVQGRG